MDTKKKFSFLSKARLLIIFLSLSVMLCQNTALAFHGRKPAAPPFRHGKSVAKLPKGFISLGVAGVLFYYSRGIFYKKGPSGFIVVNAPIGATLENLPSGYNTVLVGGNNTFFVANGVYYQKVRAGYVVVEPPAAVEVRPPAVPTVVVGKITVTAKSLNVRSGPGVEHKVIRQISQGNTLQIIGSAPEWYYVQLPDSNFGWVMEKFTTSLALPAEG